MFFFSRERNINENKSDSKEIHSYDANFFFSVKFRLKYDIRELEN